MRGVNSGGLLIGFSRYLLPLTRLERRLPFLYFPIHVAARFQGPERGVGSEFQRRVV